MKKRNNQTFPPIPDKLYFCIGEAAKLCRVSPHVLRFWEQEFPELKPSKGEGGRRYYQSKDILLARRVKELRYDKRFTIEGVRQQLREDKGNKSVVPPSQETLPEKREPSSNVVTGTIISELRSLLKYLK